MGLLKALGINIKDPLGIYKPPGIGLPTARLEVNRPSPSAMAPRKPAADPAAYARRYLMNKHKLPDHVASAIAGHGMQESKFDTANMSGDNGTAIGSFQWRGDRATGLQSFAESQGKDWTDLDVQLDYVVHELGSTEKRAARELKSSTNLEEAVTAFMHYERPHGYTRNSPKSGHGFNDRLSFAQKLAGQSAGVEAIESMIGSAAPNPEAKGLARLVSAQPQQQQSNDPDFAGALNFANEGQDKLKREFKQILLGTSAAIGEPLNIQSGYRSRNHRVERKKKSGGGEHTRAHAGDINMAGWSEAKRARVIRELHARGAKRFITYKNSPDMLHVDMKDQRGDGTAHFMFDRKHERMGNAPGWYKQLGKELHGKKAGSIVDAAPVTGTLTAQDADGLRDPMGLYGGKSPFQRAPGIGAVEPTATGPIEERFAPGVDATSNVDVSNVPEGAIVEMDEAEYGAFKAARQAKAELEAAIGPQPADAAATIVEMTEDEYAAWKADFDEKNAPSATSDFGNLLKIGAGTAMKGLDFLADKLYGETISAAMDRFDKMVFGETGKELSGRVVAEGEAGLSPAQLAARQKEFVTEQPQPDGSVKYSLGAAWTDPRSYYGLIVESLPATVLTMGPSGLLARGAFTGAIAKGLARDVAAKRAATTALVSGSIAEGLLGGADAALAVRDMIAQLPPETLKSSEAVKELIAGGMTPEQAVDALATDAETQALLIGGTLTGAFGGAGDRVLAKMLAEGVGGNVVKRAVRGAFRGAVAEGIFEELPQSVGQQVATNTAVQELNPEQRALEGVPNAAVSGAIGGAGVGGALGTAGGAASRGGAASSVPESAGPGSQVPPVELTEADLQLEAPAKPRGPLGRAVDHGNSAADGAQKNVQNVQNAPAINSTVRVEAPGVDPFMARVESIQGDEAKVFDSSSGEIFQVPLEHLSVIAEAPQPPPPDETEEPLKPADAAPELDAPVEVTDAPPVAETKPAEPDPVATTEEPAPVEPDTEAEAVESAPEPEFDPGEYGAGTVATVEPEADRPAGVPEKQKPESAPAPASAAQSTAPAAVSPVTSPAGTDAQATTRVVQDSTGTFPDAKHTQLYDYADRLRTARDSRLSMKRIGDLLSKERTAVADALGVTPERVNEIAQDYRHRVRRAAKTSAGKEFSAPPVNPRRLAEWQKERADQPTLDLDTNANEAATSPINYRPEPSDAQKEAGNYKLGHARIGGLDVSIENPAGSTRSGTNRSGGTWSIKMKSHYGYFKGTVGRDKDHIDVFIKPGTQELADDAPVVVIDQRDTSTGKFDEHKVMMGYDDRAEAVPAYMENYTPGWKGLGTATQTTLAEFKQWLDEGNTREPFAKTTPAEKPAAAAPSAEKKAEPAPAAKEAEKPSKKTSAKRDREADDQPKQKAADKEEREVVGSPYLKGGRGDRVKEVVRSKEWKKVFGSTTNINAETEHYAHPESEVAFMRVQGWLDAKAGRDPVEQDAHEGSNDPIAPYMEGYIGGRFGIAVVVRHSQAAAFRQAIIDGESSFDPANAPAATKPEKAEDLSPAQFAANKIFTADRVEAARARLKSKLGNVNSGIDPEVLVDGMTIAGAYIEAGVRDFSAYAAQMTADFGESITPYLLSFWEGARNYPDLDSTGMTSPAESAQLFAELGKDDTIPSKENADGDAEKLGRNGPETLEGTPSSEVSRAQDSREAGRSPAGGGEPDLFGDVEPGRTRTQRRGSMADGARDLSDTSSRKRPKRATSAKPDASDDGDSAARAPDLLDLASDSTATPAQNRPSGYTITKTDELGAGGQKTKFAGNMAAIQLLRKLEAENRTATRAEQAILAKWVGWGGLRSAFPREDGSIAKGWERQAEDLKALLSDEEYRAAESSTRNAHFTSEEVVNAIWNIAERLGFRGGQVLEPSVGAGNFLGLMPGDARKGSRITGIELDHITGGIARNLYPSANIQAPKGFETVTIPDDYFDLAIGNPPFGSERVYDAERPALNKFSVHNFFFAKSIDTLKPGGVLAMVVTNFFLDSSKTKAREYIAARADLVGAIRLPNTAFQKNAGTEVTTDIVVFRKRELINDGKPDAAWTETGSFTDEEGREVLLNRYFLDNPDMMLGKFGAYGTMYHGESAALIPRDGDDLPALLQKAIDTLPRDIMAPPSVVVDEVVTIPDSVTDALVGSAFLDENSDVWAREPDHVGEPRASRVEFPNNRAKDRVAGMVRIRDAFARLRRAQIAKTATDAKIDELRARLNKVYDAFARKNGPINLDANKRLFRDDPTWPQVSALENDFDKGLSATVAKRTGEKPRKPSAAKAPIFTRRTQQPYARPTSADSAKDALAQVLADYGRVDLPAMERLYGRDQDAIVRELGSLIYRTPDGSHETAEAYLSGNVKQKLAEAVEAAKTDSEMERNVSALEAVQPADIEAVDIDVKAGAPWVPSSHVSAFLDHITGESGGTATYSPANAKWIVSKLKQTEAAAAQWATDRTGVGQVVTAALNGATITVYDRTSDGKSVVNQPASEAAADKIERVKAEWRNWIWQDEDRRAELSRLYNDTFNTDVLRVYDGSHLTFPGKIGDDVIELRPHQKSFVWRAMQTPTQLADHVVGAGKTFAAIASVMEKRRVGQWRKPLMVVPNHLVGQWAADFVKLYPNARVLAATKKDFAAENRKRFFVRMATGDWDAIIVAHSSFGRIGVDPEFEATFIRDQIDDLEVSIAALRAETGKDSRSIAQLSKWRDNMDAKLKKLMESGAKDAGLNFNEIGIDGLIVDEAHEFKNLGFATSMQRVAGLGNPLGSNKAADLFIKIKAVKERTGGNNVMFLTGTPISNTMAEMFTMQRYLDEPALKNLGVAHFDAWARVFGDVVTDWELSPSGTYKLKSRFARFVNMPELMQRYLSFADVITNDDIRAQLAALGKTLPIPRIKGGKPQNIVVERSPDQAIYIGEPNEKGEYAAGTLVHRAENLPKGPPEKGADNMLKVMSDARKAALDMRLVDPDFGDAAGSKIHVAADRVKTIYDRWNEQRGTQMIFIDLSTPKAAKGRDADRIRDLVEKADKGDEAAQAALDKLSPDDLLALDGEFSVYDDLKQKLISRGIPAQEIAFIHDANTDLQKEELFGKVRSGAVRVIFGSTAKMGAGTNVQNRLVAMHHMDAPWRPSDLEQREGRIIRQGNELYAQDPDGFEVEINRYATKNTLDARMWQTIEAKARFISQVRKGATGAREIEDIGGETANAAEMKAAASGNPLILEEMDLRQKTRKLENQLREHERAQFRATGTIRLLENERRHIDETMDGAETDAAAAAAALKEAGAMIGGELRDKPKKLGGAIKSEAIGMLQNNQADREIGTYGAFKLSLHHVETKGDRDDFRLKITGETAVVLAMNDFRTTDPTGLGVRVRNTLNDFVAAPDRSSSRLGEINREVEGLRKQIGPFEGAGELEETRVRHAAVLDQLKPKKPETPPAEEGETKVVGDDEVASPIRIGENPPPLTPEDVEQIEFIVHQVAKLPTNWAASIEIPQDGSAASAWGLNAPTKAAGVYDVTKDIVVMSFAHGDAVAALHEAFHRLQYVFLTDAEKKILANDKARLRRMVRPLRGPLTNQMNQIELEAEAFASYVTGISRIKPHKAIRAKWDMIIKILRRTLNMLRGRGYQISEDIFDRAVAGNVAARAANLNAGSADVAFSVARTPRKRGLPAEMTQLTTFVNTRPMKAHPAYAAAKSGNMEAAATLVSELVKAQNIEAARKAFGSDAIYAPVTAQEAAGDNAIPDLLAAFYAEKAGGRTGAGIVQVNRAYHTGAKAMERLKNRALFEGPVEPGGRYVIVDDVTVMGSTLADMADHIQSNGGTVVGIVTLVDRSRNKTLVATRALARKIRERFDNETITQFNIEPEALTGPEAAYIINFRDVVSLRDRAAKADAERSARLRSKGIREETSEDPGIELDPDDLRPDRPAPAPPAPPSTPRKISENAILAELRGKWTDLQPQLLKTIPLNYFTELKRPNMVAVDDYLRMKRKLDAYRGQKHGEADELAQRWLKYLRLGIGKDGKARAAELSNLMHDSTLAGVDPATPSDEMKEHRDFADLSARYNALPPAARKLFKNVRDAYLVQSQELDSIVLDNVRKATLIAEKRAEEQYERDIERIERADMTDKARKAALEDAAASYKSARTKAQWSMKSRLTRLRAAFEATRVTPPYFPLGRFGRYFVLARDIDGTILSFSKRERARDRDRLAADMRKAYPNATIEAGVMEQNRSMRDAMDPRIVAEVEHILGGIGLDVSTMSGVLDQIWQRYLETMPDLSIRKRFIHRKGTAGFEQDALRVFSSHMFHAAHQMGRLKYGMELQELTNDISAQARKADDPTAAVTLADEMRARHEWVMNPTGSKFAQTMTTTAFVWYLGVTPAAAIVNMTQTPILGVPILGARFRSVRKAAAAMLKASKDSVAGRGLPSKSRLTADEQKAMQAFYDSGLIDRTQSHDLAGVGDTGVNYTPLRAKVMEKVSFLFHSAETWNREVTALAAYRMARDSGQIWTEAVNTAHELTWKTHFDYSNSSRPRVMQNDFAKVALVFRAHNINMLYRLLRDAKQMFKGDTPAARREARAQFAGIFGMMALMAGAAGVPAFNIMMLLAGMVFGADDDPFDFETRFKQDVLELLGPELGGIVLNGVPGHYGGIALTDRIGMPDLWFRSPNRDLQGKDEFDYWVINSAGASVSMIGNAWRGVQLLREGDYQNGVEALVPKWTRDLLRAYRYNQKGLTDFQGNQIIAREDMTAADIAMQAAGFTPAKVAEAWERRSALKNAETRIYRNRQKLIGRFALAFELEDDEAMDEALADIAKFNSVRLHAATIIKPATLRRSLKARATNDARRLDGVFFRNQRFGLDLTGEIPQKVYGR